MREIHIIFDGPPGPEAGRFVEVENEKRESIRVGEWEGPDEDGAWHLIIKPHPEGDNHHAAFACPFCAPERESLMRELREERRLRQDAEERERELREGIRDAGEAETRIQARKRNDASSKGGVGEQHG